MKLTSKEPRLLTLLATWLLLLGALTAQAQNVINVGPGRTYSTLRSAVLAGAVTSGTTVQIDNGTYTDFCRIQGLSNVTITSTSGRAGGVIFDGGSQDNLEDHKAIILVINSPGVAIVGIKFRNAGLGGEAGLAAQGRGAGNQAGIRFEKYTSTSNTARVSYCSFDNCVTGIFTENNDFNLSLTIDHCDFGRDVPNGQARDGGSHDAYVNRIYSLTGIDNNWYGNPYGNNCKTRAWNNTFSGGYNSNYAGRCIDIPNGGKYNITGGIYERGKGDQSQVLAYAEEYPNTSDALNNGLYSGTVSGVTLRINNRLNVWNAGAGSTMTFSNVTYEWYGSGTATTSVTGPGAVVGLATSGAATAATLPAPPPAVSSSASSTNPPPISTTLRAAETPTGTAAGVRYEYYEVTGLSVLPDFATLKAAATGTVSTFDLSPRKRDDDFAFRYTGFVRVPQDGEYTFFTSSDDGSRLHIGSQLVVDNDGLHGAQERAGKIGLKAGLHSITVTFFEAYGGQELSVSYQGPSTSKQLIPASALVSVPPTSTGGGATSTATFYRAFNLNGPATTIDGRSWQAGSGVQLGSGTSSFANQNVTLSPATDAARASMIRSSVWGKQAQVTVPNVPNGQYQLYLYVWEDNATQTYNVSVNGQVVKSNYVSGAAGRWERLGPFATSVTGGSVVVSTSGGDANLSGLELWQVGSSSPAPAGIVSGGVYRLLARHSNKALDVAYNSAASGAAVWQHTVNTSGAQNWVLQLQSDGAYKLTHEGTTQCLDVQNNSAANGALVQQYTDNGGDAQRWLLEPTSDGYYKLRHKGTDKFLDVLGGEGMLGDGDAVGQWETTPGLNQQWKLELIRAPSASRQAAPAQSVAAAETSPLSVYPNPARPGERATLSFTAEKAQRVTVFIRTQQGGLASLLTLPVQAGRTDFPLPSGLPAGTYFVQATVDGQKQSFTLQVE